MIRLFTITILLASTIWSIALAQYKMQCLDTIEITSIPYSLPYDDTCYCLTGTLSSATNGINLNGKDRILISSVGATRQLLIFAAGGSDQRYGISQGSSDWVYLNNIHVIAGLGTLNDDSDSGNNCFRSTGGHHLLIENCRFDADGLDGRCFDQVVSASSYAFNFIDNTFNTYSNKFTRRDYYMAALMKFEFGKVLDSSYHALIQGNTFERAIHVAIAMTGSQVAGDSGALVYIFDNTMHGQGRNDRYTTFTDASAQSLGDNFGISVIGLMRGSEIYSNWIYGDDVPLHYGISGMLLQGCHGWPDSPVQVYDNHMVLRSGRHIALSALKQSTQGFYVRALDNILANQNLWIYSNDIQIYVDTSQSSTSTGRVAEGARILMDDLSHDIIFANNHISINDEDSANGGGNGSGESEMFVSAITIAQESAVPAGELSIYGNYFGSIKAPVRFGSNRESILSANNIFMHNDTIVQYRDMDTTFWFETGGTFLGHATGNIHQDCTFLGYANPADIVFASGASVDSLGKSLAQYQTVHLVCLGSDGQPLAAVGVFASDAYDNRFLGYSNSLGIVDGILKLRYDHHDYITSDSYNPGDSLFNPYTFTAYTFGGTDTAIVVATITASNYTDTLQFDNIAGEAPTVGTLFLFGARGVIAESQLARPPEQ